MKERSYLTYEQRERKRRRNVIRFAAVMGGVLLLACGLAFLSTLRS